MYSIDDKFLYEVFEDYGEADTQEEKAEIVSKFCEQLWKVKNYRNYKTRVISYFIPKKVTGEIREVFEKYQRVEYLTVSTKTTKTDSWTLLKQVVNNLYTHMCDVSICIQREYLDLLFIPKQMFVNYMKGNKYPPEYVDHELKTALDKSKEIFDMYANRKLNLNWNDYKILIEKFMKRIFDNYKPLSENEDLDRVILDVTFWIEDNYIIKYINKSLRGYIYNFQKEVHGVHRNKPYTWCSCGNMFEKVSNSHKYCKTCSDERKLMRYRKYNNKRKNHK